MTVDRETSVYEMYRAHPDRFLANSCHHVKDDTSLAYMMIAWRIQRNRFDYLYDCERCWKNENPDHYVGRLLDVGLFRDWGIYDAVLVEAVRPD